MFNSTKIEIQKLKTSAITVLMIACLSWRQNETMLMNDINMFVENDDSIIQDADAPFFRRYFKNKPNAVKNMLNDKLLDN